jgi:hypothetical protein
LRPWVHSSAGKKKKAGGEAQVVEYLPSKHDKALEFQSPVLPKKKKKKVT